MDRSLFSKTALASARARYEGKEADNPAPISLREQLTLLKSEVRHLNGVMDQQIATGKILNVHWAEGRKRERAAIVASFELFVEAVEGQAE